MSETNSSAAAAPAPAAPASAADSHAMDIDDSGATAAAAAPLGDAAAASSASAGSAAVLPTPPPSAIAPSPLPLGALAEELGGAPPPLLADGSVDDDALIEAALAESARESAAGDAAAAEEEGDQPDTDDDAPEGEESEAAANARIAALLSEADSGGAPAAASVPGETYISESGEVMRRRAPRKKKPVEAAVVDEAQAEADRKAAAERAETLLTNLLKRTNDVMLRTMEGTAAGGAAAAPAARKKKPGAPRRKSEKEEDEELLGELQEDTLPNGAVQLLRQPSLVTGVMRAYQLEGLNWMIRLYHSGVSGILADEMGLGKTLQAISLLAYLREYQNLPGPHLVLVPLSTLGNWHREFTRWCPSIRCFRFHGTREERAAMVAEGQLKPDRWDVLLTSYEMSIREKAHIQKVKWNFIVVDEAHRLKNEGSLLSQIVRIFSSRNRLLLTGTPLQNNLHELWALLNFLLPDIFSSSSDFDEIFSTAQTDVDVSSNLLAQLHKVLRPFMLRRLKSSVATDLPPKKETLLFVGMSEMQAKLYRSILEKDIDAVLGKTNQKSRLLNIVMQLRKAANHPYLFEGVEDRTLPPYGDHLIYTSGKMSVLDKLLARFRAEGSRVLIFSQMTRTLDILEDYCLYRQYAYSRIDGSTLQEDREVSMRDFNAEDSQKFIFLLSTRAGGLGINLTGANIVILFDSDAMDRAHRIGQKKKVFVYRLIAEHTIEEKIIERAEIKLRLDAVVIQQGRTVPKGAQGKGGTGAMTADDMSAMIRFGADRVFKQQGSTITDADIDNILQAAEVRTQELQSKLGKHVGMLDLSLDGAPPMMLPSDEAESELAASEELERQLLLSMHDTLGERKRDRKGKSYNENAYFRDAMKDAQSQQAQHKSHLPKPYKIPRMPDYQLFNNKRINELSEKEKAWYEKHQHDTTVPAIRGGLTAEEDAELQQLLSRGFPDMTWADYNIFLAACRRYGGKASALDRVVAALEGRRTREDVERYHRAFFEWAPHAQGFKSQLIAIARGEARVKKFAEFEEQLERLLQDYTHREDVMDRLNIPYTPLHRGKGFTVREDRFLLWCCRELGYGEWHKLRSQIRRDAEFRFDYFLKSRSISQLSRRVDVLLRAMNKSTAKAQGKKAAQAAAAGNERTTGADAATGAVAGAQAGAGARVAPPLGVASTAAGASASLPTGVAASRVDSDAPLSVKRAALKAEPMDDHDRPGLASGALPLPGPQSASAALSSPLSPSLLRPSTLVLLSQLPAAEDDMPLAARRHMLTHPQEYARAQRADASGAHQRGDSAASSALAPRALHSQLGSSSRAGGMDVSAGASAAAGDAHSDAGADEEPGDDDEEGDMDEDDESDSAEDGSRADSAKRQRLQ